MIADQRLRDKQLHTARHVNEITEMITRTHTGLTIIDIAQVEEAHSKLGFHRNGVPVWTSLLIRVSVNQSRLLVRAYNESSVIVYQSLVYVITD